jgi:hypothetical protein
MPKSPASAERATTWRRSAPRWIAAGVTVAVALGLGPVGPREAVAAPDGGATDTTAARAPALTVMAGHVTDQAGAPLAGIMVFAADARTDRIASMAVSDEEGNVRLPVGRGRHNFGVVSPSLAVAQLSARGVAGFDLVLQPRPGVQRDSAEASDQTGAGARVSAPTAFVLRGRVVDETGVGLEGTRVEALRGGGDHPVTSAMSGEGGRFALGLPGGAYFVRVFAPGLKTSRLARRGGEVILVMAIAAEPQRVDVGTGHTLRFRLQDSIDPEYSPPAPVRAWLQAAYGICASTNPLRARERRELKKYWYLDILRTAPPNPATISTANCAPPSQYQRMPWSMGQDFVMLPDGFGYSEEDPGRERIDPPK